MPGVRLKFMAHAFVDNVSLEIFFLNFSNFYMMQ